MVTEMTLSDLMARDGRLSSSGSDSSSLLSGSDSSSSSSSESDEDTEEEVIDKPLEKVRLRVSLTQAKEIKAQAAAAAAAAAATTAGTSKSKKLASKKAPAAAAPKVPPKQTKAKTAASKVKTSPKPRGGKKTDAGKTKQIAAEKMATPTHAAIKSNVSHDIQRRAPVVKKATDTTIQLVKGDPGVKCKRSQEECRGRRELELVDPSKAADAVIEINEDDLDGSVFNVNDDRGDVLRNLDMFYFCDEQGNAISLDVFELPREQRPLIMGFGTVIQPLPIAELPAPIRYYMPDIVPSSTRKGKRTKKSSKGKRKSAPTSVDDFSDSSSNLGPRDGKRTLSDADDPAPKKQKTLEQVDGTTVGDKFRNVGVPASPFKSFYYPYKKKHISALYQMDGASDNASESSSSDSEGSSSDGSNSSNNSMNCSPNRKNSDTDSESKPRTVQSDGNDSDDSKPISSMKKKNTSTPSSYCKVHKMTPKVVGADLDDLMRADGMHSVAIDGVEEELDLLECGFRYPTKCTRQRVWLPEITDWCLDYSDGDPTLWVITKNAWYKIAGPISGMLPHWSYRSQFTKPRLMFEACFHIAFVLREWLPKNPGLAYRSTLQQVIEQSILGRYPLTTKFMIENYKFIASQLGNLGEEYGGNWLDSAFFKQLQRMNDSFNVRVAKAEKSKAESEARRLLREKEVTERRQKAEDERLKKEGIRKQKESERLEKKKYPMEDLEVLLELPEDEQSKRPGHPTTPFPLVEIGGSLLGELLMTFQTLNSYRSFIVDCPRIEFTQLLKVAMIRTILLSENSQTFSKTHSIYGKQTLAEAVNVFTWPEVLRQLICPEEESIGHMDPIIGCQLVHQTLSSHPNALAFLNPVDIQGLGLADYTDVVKTPMDLSTIGSKLELGAYDNDEGSFLKDVKLIWSNAVQYNGEESEIGKTASMLSDICQAEYQRFVVRPKEIFERRKFLCQQDQSLMALHHALYVYDFSELPLAFRVSAFSWVTNEFFNISTVRAEIERNVELEFEIMRDFRKEERDVEALRRNSDKNRREREDQFRQMCINQGIPTNYNNVFSDATKKKHEFIAEFYTNITNERIAEETTYASERHAKEHALHEQLKALSVRFEQLGKDRYHVRYWFFQPGWLFREDENGAFVVYTDRQDIEELLMWLNPKGVREMELKHRLEAVFDNVVSKFDTINNVTPYVRPTSLVNVVGLPIETMEKFNIDGYTSNLEAIQHALLTLNNYVYQHGCVKVSFSNRNSWLASVKSGNKAEHFRLVILELEKYFSTSLNDDLIQQQWKRKRREWQMGVEGSQTFAQLLFLMNYLLQECFVLDAFVDYVVQLDRKEWFKLRPKSARNFCPEVDQDVVYFGDGHAQAMKDDKKNKKPVKCDAPLLKTTIACKVTNVSYHHGSGDPYALVTMVPHVNSAFRKTPGELLCTPPSSVQRLGRVLMRIVGKLRSDPDSGPFLEPVSKVDFPTYTDIILKPMDLSKIANKVKTEKYNNVKDFVDDLKLMADNCSLFCEGRFPTLPPMARHLVTICEALVKKYSSELKAAIGNSNEANLTAVGTEIDSKISDKLIFVVRLENRLPEFIVDAKRYEFAINRPWKSGEKVRILFRDPKGIPTEYFSGVAAGSLPYDVNGFLPWEALRITWDEDDGSEDSRVNPWEAEVLKK
ncbi:Aste57867_24503 [Aphanomyces stellatus]|uniref:Aste57867_24503 protein n=1 Tax=Aphanomyces stellatus TaxID=120398 RepID=A0A485LQJ0_9STRA|nr:hypothetical protein As57867_024426 [Aphanomyces stellatus]VFU01142.1 Aste57867_24503 [Aphanomyces stellatus]